MMVLSVVAMSAAFAGTAAAGVSSADRTVADAEVSPNGETTVTTTVTMDDNGGSLTVNEMFSPAFQDVTIDSVTVNGNDASPVVSAAEERRKSTAYSFWEM